VDIIICGDLVPTRSNIELFDKGNVTELLGDKLLAVWSKANFRIFNLEVPLTDIEEPIDKCGLNLIAPTSVIEGIRALSPSVIALANNHILDQGVSGLNSTLRLLTQFDIPFVGAGKDVNEASKPYIIDQNGIKVGIYACTEHEFSIASDRIPGANPFDPLESLDHISTLKTECDFVIVLYHGGKEHYHYPSPYLQKVCRKIVQKGADLVVCQHSHCVGCYENYNGSTIIYGQGNFIFDASESENWKTSLLIKASIREKLSIEYIPVKKDGNVVRLAEGKDAANILDAFYMRSNEILLNGFIEYQYQKFAYENTLHYIRQLAGFSKWLSIIDRRLLNGILAKHRYSKKQLLTIRNYIECESHRELLLQGLSMSRINKK